MAKLKIVGFERGHTSPIESPISHIDVTDDVVVLGTDANGSYITLWLNNVERAKLAELFAQPKESSAHIRDERTKK